MLGLSDPGLDAAERMGVADALRAARHMPRRLAYMDSAGRERFAIDGPAIDRLVGDRQFNLMRGDIERMLYGCIHDRVDVRFGVSVASVEVAPDGVGVRLSDGTAVEAELLVGADGLHSRVRTLRFGAEDQFVQPLHARVAAFLLDKSEFPDALPGASYSSRKSTAPQPSPIRATAGWSRSSSGARRGGHASAQWRRNCAALLPGRAGTFPICWTGSLIQRTYTSTRWPRW
ncbi:FAD-dependent monooxygenase [Siccirubricoccus deserti]